MTITNPNDPSIMTVRSGPYSQERVIIEVYSHTDIINLTPAVFYNLLDMSIDYWKIAGATDTEALANAQNLIAAYNTDAVRLTSFPKALRDRLVNEAYLKSYS